MIVKRGVATLLFLLQIEAKCPSSQANTVLSACKSAFKMPYRDTQYCDYFTLVGIVAVIMIYGFIFGS